MKIYQRIEITNNKYFDKAKIYGIFFIVKHLPRYHISVLDARKALPYIRLKCL